MDGQYTHPIPPYGAFNPYGQQPMVPPEMFQPRLQHVQPMTSESLAGSYSDFDDPNRAILPPRNQPPRPRRRQPSGSEHVKHRRTRSGCYTCRQRRVKCDETHPICDRCRKGKRDCVYPEHQSSSKSSRSRDGSKNGHGDNSSSSQSGDDFDPDVKDQLSPILDGEDLDAEEEDDLPSALSDSQKQSDLLAVSIDKPLTPVLDTPSSFMRSTPRPGAIRSNSKLITKPNITATSKWHYLPKDVKFYLKYHQNSLSHHHYAFKYDGGGFLKTTYLEIAINYEPLLYAVVAFAAYHYALTRSDGKVRYFLNYYNQSVSLLRQSLAKSDRHSVSTLLTILQLATIEEFLGDWVNLLSHQRAAHRIITDLFTPYTIMQSETHRKIINWYIRFDLFAGMMSGGKTVLGREWFAACADFYERQSRDKPNDLGASFEGYFATSRLLATDVALLFAAKSTEAISDEEFGAQAGELMEKMSDFRTEIETAFTDPSCFVKAFPNAPPPSSEDITDYTDPNFTYAGELFTMNYILIDHWAIYLMFRYQLCLAQQEPQIPSELMELALRKCKMLEAIEFCDHGPPGAILGCQASLGIASLFLPKDTKHMNWCRRKFAMIESSGYVYPPNLRQRMSDLWGEDVTHWWLPNEEGYPPIIRAIRDFIEYRSSSALRQPDAKDADVRDMNGIFRSLNLDSTEDDSEYNRFDDLDAELVFDPSMIYESSPDQPHV